MASASPAQSRSCGRVNELQRPTVWETPRCRRHLRNSTPNHTAGREQALDQPDLTHEAKPWASLLGLEELSRLGQLLIVQVLGNPFPLVSES